MADTQEIYARLLAKSYQETLFADLPGKRVRQKAGKETLVDCPFCGKEGHFSYASHKPLWRCWSCGKKGDWISYLEERKKLPFLDVLQLLADAAGVEIEQSQASKEKHQSYVRRAELLEAAQDILAGRLQEPAGEPVKLYLMERGYSEAEIESMELGAYTDPARLKKELLHLGYTEQQIKDSGLEVKAWLTHPLTLLYRDPAGRAIGLAGRNILSRDESKTKGLAPYHYSASLSKSSGLIGLASVRGAEQLLLVEGLLDALYLNSLGFQAVSIGGTDLALAQIKALQANGTKELLLALDMDKPGWVGTEKAISSLRLSKLRAYVVSLPAGYKDPDELVRAKGKEALQEAMRQAEAWPRWLARRLVQQHDVQTDIGRDRALEAALAVYHEIEDKLEARAFWESLRASVGLSEEELVQQAREEGRKASQRRSQELLQATVRKLQAEVADGDALGAEQAIEESLHQLRASRGVLAPEPYLMEDFSADLASMTAGLSTGWSKLDELARLPQGAITLIAGRPGQGKTTLLLNLLANMLNAYPDKSFYFFSYEEGKSWLALKLIMAMAGKVLHPAFNLEAYLNYIREKRASEPVAEIERAIRHFEKWTASGRLWLSDKRLPAEDLASTIGFLAQRGEVGAVLLDYIQKIPLARPSKDQRYVEIKRVSDLLLEQAVRTGVPITMGAQFARAQGKSSPVTLDNLRESGDLEQDANLVLGLWNKSYEEAEKEGKTVDRAEVDLKVTVLKQRGGIAGKSCYLAYNMPAYQIKDQQKAGSGLA